MVPHGFRFNPTDEELIQVLDRKASGHEMPLNFILEMNVYEREPQDLEWSQSTALSNGERFYYCKREINDSREVLGRGWWKATSHVKKVYANDHQLLVGNKRPLTFHRFKDNERNRNNAVKTNWIMHEYSLESRTTEWRLCKIKYKGKPSLQEEIESIKRQHSSRNDFEAGSSTNAGAEQHEEETLVPADSTMPLDHYSGYDQQPHNQWNNMQQPPPPSPYHPYLPALCASSGHYYVNQQEELEPAVHEQPFPSLWSWTN
ncbi:hypothetical protein NC652_019695 [Populus alba x Populus x berolinensis]|uniref:NAC domain-containing protein n=1 Tax=Populus tomentosa TaxID=118781 RepID=A0A8X7ZG21_POPTO|nr:hypothetical protein POTOM_027618 [Populus tomentosa]KAJ6917417.1 hypothetical protein NC652_019695 [Populus alba x Populus x berolinensis]